MKNFALLIITLISSSAVAVAQNDKKPEFFAGYSFESINTGVSSGDLSATTTSLDNRFKANGLNLSASDYFSKRLGVTADFSAHFNSRSDTFGSTAGQSKFSLYNITGGPQLRFLSRSKLSRSTRWLAGLARGKLKGKFSDRATNFNGHNNIF